MNHNKQKKIAVINDMSGFGKCSLTVSIPIISHLGIQCCPLPTAIFSNHTGYDSYYFNDYTSHMRPYMEEWDKLDLYFEGIATGFLGSEAQIEVVKDFFGRFKKEDTTVLVDPVMGDHGKIYSTYTKELCDKMKELVNYADIITPNLTEACVLTNTDYKESHWSSQELEGLCEKLHAMGPSKIVITGIPQKSFVANYVYEEGTTSSFIKTQRIGTERAGTGDVFASILIADAVNGIPFSMSVKKASSFIKKCVSLCVTREIDSEDGLAFEPLLKDLK